MDAEAKIKENADKAREIGRRSAISGAPRMAFLNEEIQDLISKNVKDLDRSPQLLISAGIAKEFNEGYTEELTRQEQAKAEPAAE